MKVKNQLRKKFICPGCNEEICAPVTDMKPGYIGSGVWRYRKCEKCGVVFVTTEKVWYITKRKGRNVTV